MRFVAAAALVVAVSCGPVSQPVEKDAGVVVIEVTKPTLTCVPQRFDLVTTPALAAATLQLSVTCVGDADPRETNVVATFTRLDGSAVDVEATTTMKTGDVSVTLEVPTEVITVGEQRVLVWAKGDNVDWFDAEELSLRGHQPVSQLTEQWADAAPFTLPALETGAKRVAVLVRDFNADDELDLMVITRNADKLTVQTWLGPKLDVPTSNTYTDARFDVGDAVENVRFLRRRGASTDKSGALAWWAVAGAEGRVATIDLDSGVAKQQRTFASTSLPAVTRLLGVDAVIDGVADGAAPELVFFYLGDKAGTPEFVTLTTQSLAAKFSLTSELTALGGITPTDVLNGAYIGLLRSWKVTTHPRDAVDLGNLHAWVALMGTPPSMRVLRVAISGPGAGNAFPEGAYETQAGEKLLSISSADADGDARPDVVVLGQLTDGRGLAHVLLNDATGTLSAAQTTALDVSLDDAAKVFTSAQAPETKSVCLRERGGQVCGSTSHFLVVSGGSVGGVPVVTAVGNGKAEVMPMSTPTRLQRSGPGRSGRGSSARYDILPDGRVHFGFMQADDSVKLGSTPLGESVSLTSTGGLEWQTHNSAALLRTDSKPLRGFWSFDDSAAQDSSFLIIPNSTATGATWEVWWSSPRGVVGPSTWSVPGALGEFAPMAISGKELVFARSDDSSLQWLHLSTTEAAMLAAQGADFTFDTSSLTKGPGKAALFYGREGVRVAHVRKNRSAPPVSDDDLLRPPADVGTGAAVETVAVLGVDDTDACPFQTLYFAGDVATVPPVVLAEGSAANCADLDAPVMVADFLGIGGEQLLTSRSSGSGDALTWHFTLWVRGETTLSPVSLADVPGVGTEAPVVSASDVNGDGAVDVLISFPGQPTSIFFSNGRGQSFGGASVPGLSDTVREVPGAAPGFGGGQLACGAGLQCQFGSGTRTSAGQASSKAELL